MSMNKILQIVPVVLTVFPELKIETKDNWIETFEFNKGSYHLLSTCVLGTVLRALCVIHFSQQLFEDIIITLSYKKKNSVHLLFA